MLKLNHTSFDGAPVGILVGNIVGFKRHDECIHLAAGLRWDPKEATLILTSIDVGANVGRCVG